MLSDEQKLHKKQKPGEIDHHPSVHPRNSDSSTRLLSLPCHLIFVPPVTHLPPHTILHIPSIQARPASLLPSHTPVPAWPQYCADQAATWPKRSRAAGDRARCRRHRLCRVRGSQAVAVPCHPIRCILCSLECRDRLRSSLSRGVTICHRLHRSRHMVRARRCTLQVDRICINRYPIQPHRSTTTGTSRQDRQLMILKRHPRNADRYPSFLPARPAGKAIRGPVSHPARRKRPDHPARASSAGVPSRLGLLWAYPPARPGLIPGPLLHPERL